MKSYRVSVGSRGYLNVWGRRGYKTTQVSSKWSVLEPIVEGKASIIEKRVDGVPEKVIETHDEEELINALKHYRGKHNTDKCPICREEKKNITLTPPEKKEKKPEKPKELPPAPIQPIQPIIIPTPISPQPTYYPKDFVPWEPQKYTPWEPVRYEPFKPKRYKPWLVNEPETKSVRYEWIGK